MQKSYNKLENYYNVVVPANLADDEFVRVIAIRKKDETKDKEIPPRILFYKTYEEFADFVKKYRHNWNLYISSSTVKQSDDDDNIHGKAKNLCRRQTVFLDFDKKDFPQYKDIKDFTTHIKRKLPTLFNHCIVDSGNGFHFYIAIKPTKNVRRVAKINEAIARIVNADLNATKSTQIMRIPTSLNLKEDEPKTVSIIAETYGTDKFRPYKLEQLESIISFAQKNADIANEKPELPKKEYSEFSSYYCIEKMIHEGCDKGERNFCLGRIIKYLQNVKGFNEFNALRVVTEWNARCRPQKNNDEILADFKSYWDKNYNLLGCTVPNEKHQCILSKYCDRYQCKTIQNGETRGIVEGKELKIDNHLLDNRMMRKLNGNHYLILTILHIHDTGLRLNQLNQAITTKTTKKPCLDHRTLNKVLKDLEKGKHIKCDYGLYKLINIKNYAMGFTHYYYSATILRINKIITAQQYLIYLALVRNLQQSKDVTYNTLSNDLDIEIQNIRKGIKALHDGHILQIEKVYTEKGVLANRYILVA